MKNQKDKALLTLILTVFFGWFGYYRLAKNQIGLFVLWLLTCGLFGIGWIVDIICALVDYLSTPSIPTNPSLLVSVPVQKPTSASSITSNLQLYKQYTNVELFCQGDMESDFSSFRKGDKIVFEEDENNIHDSGTILIYTESYDFVGYMYNNTLREMMHKYIDIESEYIVEGIISKCDEENEKAYLDINIYTIKSQPQPQRRTYVINPDNKKIHCPSCSAIRNAKHLKTINDISIAKKQGYTACGICKPY